MAATATVIRDAIERQHPDAGVLLLDARCGQGRPRKLAHRPRNEEAAEDVMDMVVVLNPPPHDDPRSRRTRE
jgi:predicted metalloprotease